MKKFAAKIEMDDAFTPKEIIFQEGEKRIEFFEDGESIRVQVYSEEEFVAHMRIPLYARTALAQMFTFSLNGLSLYQRKP